MTTVHPIGGAAEITCGQPLVTCDADLRVVGWNDALEAFTGVPSREVVGRGCWEVVDAVDATGASVCRPDCLHGRLARAGCAVSALCGFVRTGDGRRPVSLSTVTVRSGRRLSILHIVQPVAAPATNGSGGASPAGRRGPVLTSRQRQVLALLSEGVPAKVIAHRLGIRETTVRNHIHAILCELGCHSQLEAIARARRDALI
ncbi:MAG: LuxR C-terminal-related transcriptional regulator [Actinomycetota bacterium]